MPYDDADDHDLTETQRALRDTLRTFARERIAPGAATWDAEHTFPVDVVRAMGDLGLFGIPFPAEVGGGDGDLATLCVAIEEIGRVDQSLGITLEAAVGLGAGPIARYGTDAQRSRWLPDLCAGRALAAFALTEPDAGSDTSAITTRATLDGDTWVITGSKEFITNAGTPLTSVVTVCARTGPEEISTILVPAGTPGMEVGPPYRKIGWHASDTRPIRFDGCRVPAGNLLGARGRGLHQMLAILDEGRVAIAALACGLIAGCLDAALDHAVTRRAFGRPIGGHQAVAFACADLEVALQMSRALTRRAARMRDAGVPFTRAAAVAKLAATEAAVGAARTAVQILGGAGYLDDHPVARFYRDAKILEIGEGTSEIQRLVIARHLGLPV